MYDSLGISSNASVNERDVVSIFAGPTIIVNPGVDDGKNVANTVDLVNGVHGTMQTMKLGERVAGNTKLKKRSLVYLPP
jgi:hypothetical protein